MEYCGHGPVMKYDEFTEEFSINDHYVNNKKRKTDYSEEELRDMVRDIVCGLDYLHTNNIIHRDIKPDNVLLDENNRCKITDFNVSNMLQENEDKVSVKAEGTMFFQAPECCDSECKDFAGKPLDIWALGVTIYIFVYKELPFKPENPENIIELLDMIANAEYKYLYNFRINYPLRRYVSPELLDLISKCLEKDPFRRATARELKKHPWINKGRELLSKQTAEKIHVSEDEIKKSLNFFTSLQLAVILYLIIF
jgi:[calcium/calmodulin-dependent protein kinase] kinase